MQAARLARLERLDDRLSLTAGQALQLTQLAVHDCVAQLLRPRINEDLSVVFYDLTTIRAAGLSQEDGDLRRFGMSKEGVVARQFMLGVVQTADGMPIFHEVFDGNTAEAPTLQPTLKKVLPRLPHIRRLVVVADRGLLSLDNIEALTKLQVAGGAASRWPLEFILAVPGRRYAEFVELLQPIAMNAAQAAQASGEIVAEAAWQGHRLVVAHNPVQAAEQTQDRLAPEVRHLPPVSGDPSSRGVRQINNLPIV